MASTSRYGYEKLTKFEGLFLQDQSQFSDEIKLRQRSNNIRFRKFQFKRRLKVRIPSLKRLLTKKARLISAAWRKVVKRLKENQHHLGDLFAGNYLFMQVSPTNLKTFQQKSLAAAAAASYSAADRRDLSALYKSQLACYSVGRRDLSA